MGWVIGSYILHACTKKKKKDCIRAVEILERLQIQENNLFFIHWCALLLCKWPEFQQHAAVLSLGMRAQGASSMGLCCGGVALDV